MGQRFARRGAALLCLLALGAGAGPAGAARCGTGRHELRERRPAPLRPLPLTLPPGGGAPGVAGASAHRTEHFRVLWGDAHDASHDRWQDPDGDGVPAWVEGLGRALEEAYAVQTGLGFPAPYGIDRCAADPAGGCRLDAYVGNTGVQDDGQGVTIGPSFYAYTEIDARARAAYFVFNFETVGSAAVLRATAAHELFHAVQRAMGYPWDDESPATGISWQRWEREGWWLEAAATWVEEVSFPEVDDYVPYVDGFLAHPHWPLNALDGLHEYGAALFAGYLWGRYGGAELLREVGESVRDLELEPALRAALGARGAGPLEDVVAAFWAAAAAPSPADWPDAERFRAAARLAEVPSLPRAVAPTAATRPGRFGANLVRLAAATLPVAAELSWADPAAEWRLASRPGSGGAAAVLAPAPSAAVTVAGDGGGRPVLLAVVNTAAGEGDRDYTLQLGEESSGGSPFGSGDGGGGCFLGSLSR